MGFITHLMVYFVGLLTGIYAAYKIEKDNNKKSNDE
jgi:hypothetical protein